MDMSQAKDNDRWHMLKRAMVELGQDMHRNWLHEMAKMKATRTLTKSNVKAYWFQASLAIGLDMEVIKDSDGPSSVLLGLWFETEDYGTLQVGMVTLPDLRFVPYYKPEVLMTTPIEMLTVMQ